MVAPLLPDQIDDMVNLTLDKIIRNKWEDLSLNLQEYIALPELLKRRNKSIQGGTQVTWKVQLSNLGNARVTEMYAVDQTSVGDISDSCSAPWTKQTANFSYDIDEPAFQSGPEMLVSDIKMREHSMWNDFAELMEQLLWGSGPTSTTQRPRPPFSLPWWIVKNATAGFNGGGAPAFEADVCGLNPATVSAWNNYTFTYAGGGDGSTITRDDFVESLKKAFYQCHFKAPRNYPALTGKKTTYDYGLFTTYVVRAALEKIAESRNDNLGTDMAKYMDAVTFKGNPVTAVPYLDNNDVGASGHPFYGVNWRSAKFAVKSGRNFHRHPAKINANAHTVREVHVDHWGQLFFTNRRNNFVAYDTDAA